MKKLFLSLLLAFALTVVAVPAIAGSSIVEGSGVLTIQTLEQNEILSPPGQQLTSEWFRLRGSLGLGIRFCPITGLLIFCGEKETDKGITRMYMVFQSAGLVGRYNIVKDVFRNGHIVFNGTGHFFFMDVDINGDETPSVEYNQTQREDGTFECGKAYVNGKITFTNTKNGIVGRLNGVQVGGGNLGWLFRGSMTGKVELFEKDE